MVRSNSIDSCYSSIQDVTYSCGYCGYALNLSSAARNTANIGSKYGKQIRKKGIVAFVAVDETRFTQADEVTCAPRLRPWTWRLFRRRSRLLCGKCGGRIGAAYEVDEEDEDPAGLSACGGSDDDDDDLRTSPGDDVGASRRRNYLIRIGALQPSTDDPPPADPFSL
ncbi:hypothetical protein CFC21_036817 [Triticum aestivum]|uniref:Uncharacterized protein n=4 Tax=Triticum TaxID=4564 RepID=M7Z5F5_TRIUA|nr:uncharacterized protein At4g08330, chloroplastic-like [Triticum aestivum]XP_048565055.1 uncharacterized protein At4g08330, chloroplastic-like [Triticum urartu]EMS47605.1 hypothetical protein TRIUR3_05498 [Triticum urartu]KAF7024471.1 hypothetical protein CFC21_036817 [Triticum aestivum]VAH65636.1 unnamed protein product [Triticum turgidum subsp. durum]